MINRGVTALTFFVPLSPARLLPPSVYTIKHALRTR